MNPQTIANYSQATANVEAWFTNLARIAQYGDQATNWKALAEPMANIGQEPPPPPVPPFAVEGYVDTNGNAAVRDVPASPNSTAPFVCPQVPAIHAKPGTLMGTCGIVSGVYQDPNTLRIWVPTHSDTEPVGYVAHVSGIPGVKDGTYVKTAMSMPMPGWTGPGYYDPQVS
jgi:hypothetical protein